MVSQRLLTLLLLTTLCILSINIESTIADAQFETTKIFIRFDRQKLETGSIIDLPIRCPPEKLKVGKRCRTVF